MAFKIDPPYSNQAAAQSGYDTKAKELEGQGYTMSSPNIGNNTISGLGTKTTNVKAPKAISGGTAGTPWDNKMKSLLASGVSYEELAKPDPVTGKSHGTVEGLKKRFPGAYKPKQEKKEIKTEWSDASSGKTVNETKVDKVPTRPAETIDVNSSSRTELTTDPDKTGILPINEGGTDTKKATKQNRTAYSGPEKVDTTPAMTGGGGSSDYSHDMKLVKTDVVA